MNLTPYSPPERLCLHGCVKHFDDRATARDAANILRAQRHRKRSRWDVQACPVTPGAFIVVAAPRASRRRSNFRRPNLAPAW
jgi:hypothetical protein